MTDNSIPGLEQSETPDEDEGSITSDSLPLGHHYDHFVHTVPEVNDEYVLRFRYRLTLLLDGLREAGRVIQEVEKEHTNTMELWRKRHSNSNRQEGSDDGGSSKHGGFIGPRGP